MDGLIWVVTMCGDTRDMRGGSCAATTASMAHTNTHTHTALLIVVATQKNEQQTDKSA